MKPYSKRHLFSLVLVFLLALLPVTGFSQGEEKVKKDFVEAESYYLFEEYKDALPLYQKILRADPDNYNINFKIGVCYLNDDYQAYKSIPYLEKAVKGISKECKTTSFKERQAPPEALYYLGNAYRANDRLREAIDAYEKFKQILDPVVYDVNLVNEQIEACKYAAEQHRKPMYFIAMNLGEPINDRFEENNPCISGDEKVLAFTRRLQFYDGVFCSRRINGKWSEPINLTPSFAVDGNSYCTGLSYNGDEIFVYRSDNFDGNLYVSKYRNGKWSKLEKLNGNINTKYWESHASVSKDGKTLFFTSNREGGYGGLDIYRSERTRGGDWGPAVNLGPVINTRYNEDTPFLSPDGNILYFSSMGHDNMGGYDIFYSIRSDDGQWSKPENIGYPLNTTKDDVFFCPLRDGSFGYYSRYDVQDSYGMTDLYKLEVFTDIHPRKFILNGITRIDGKLSPDYSHYTATLINVKTGKVVDQTNLNSDGTYTLNAYSGDFDLQIKGKGINDNVDRISIPVNNPSNIISHSSVLTAATAASNITAQQAAEIPKAAVTAGPKMTVTTESYNVITNESIPIRLDLEKDTRLTVNTSLNGELKKTEQFDINKRKFIYMLTPEPGANTLRFTLKDENGDSTVREITIVYTPAEGLESASLAEASQRILSDSNKYMGMVYMSDGKLGKFLQSQSRKQMQFGSISGLYDYLLDNAAAQGYSLQEIEDLITRFLAQKDLNVFYQEFESQASDSLVKTVDNLNLASNNIFTSEALVDFLYKNSPKANYRLEDLRKALYSIAANNRDPLELISLFESYATGDLQRYLGQMKQLVQNYSSSREVADDIIKAAENKLFPLRELESMLKLAATDINVNYLMQGLIYISSDSLRKCVLELNASSQQIRNSRDLISYLLGASPKHGYSKKEVLEHVEKLRRDPYYYVDLFRKMLAEKATGTLKEFLQEINVRNLKLDTFEELLNYLLNQSKYHRFNREMVYQLLIDIINPRNVTEFINMLKLCADERIVKALNTIDIRQYSRPLEVMQYLLSVSEDFGYTERDLLRALLKLVLRKGPSPEGYGSKSGWFASLEKPILVTSLIAVNVLIVVLLIVFLMRKKRKHE